MIARRLAPALLLILAVWAGGCQAPVSPSDDWRRADAQRDQRTRERIASMPATAQAELAGADSASALADSLLAVGDVAAAVRTRERELETRRRWLGSAHERTAASVSGLARTVLAAGDIPRAITLDREALRVRKRVLGERHPDVAESLDQLAVDLKSAGGSRDEPMRLYREALALRSDLLGPASREVVVTLGHIANLHRVRREPDSALAVFERVLERGRALPDSEATIAETRFSMAMTVTPLGEWSRAEAWLAESVARLRRLGPSHRPTLGRALGAHGLALRHLGRLAAAESVLVESAAIFEDLRRRAPAGPTRMVMYPLVSHELLAAVELELGRGDRAWESAERGLARSLIEDLSASGAVDTSGWWNRPLPQIQRALAPDAALIGWLTQRAGATTEEYPFWCYCIRSRGPVTWRRVDAPEHGPRAPADQDLDRLRRELVRAASWPMRVAETPALEQLASAAYRLRMAPLEPCLSGVRRLIVISPDLLHGAPIELMRDSLGRRLGDRFTVSYAPSALLYARSVTTGAQRLPPARWDALLIGDPPAGKDGQRPGSRPALPAAREEIRQLAALLPSATVLDGADASPAHLGRLARAGALANYQLVHFATHATGDETWLREAALVFGADASTASSESVDRLATTEIASSWRLDADLVTLAACQSMIGPASKTEGFLGLQQALLAVGARRLLVSAWRVDDQATELLMRRFYQLLLARSDRRDREALALADARRWVRDWTAPDGSRPYAHPVYWAGFVLIEGGLGGRPHERVTNVR